MKIAVLSDIHGNHLALSAVLEEAEKRDVEYLFVLGDLVGYYYHPDKVIKLLKNWRKSLIQGNHEYMLKLALKDNSIMRKLQNKFGSGLNFALEKLSKNEIQTLIKLPHSQLLKFDKVKFLLCHGSPWNRDKYIYPDADLKLLNKCSTYDADFILMGHTHYPYIYQNNKKSVINVGSVGQLREKGGVASWCIIQTENRVISFRYTNYDPKEIIADVKKVDPNIPYLHQVLVRM